ncbi:MAG: hypothetical protein KKG76_06365 [Euryarchaeota archaeon]|nr:hypothetical protein [Euryarchaeota archaeon]
MDKWEYVSIQIGFEPVLEEMEEKIRQEARRLKTSNGFDDYVTARKVLLPLEYIRKITHFDDLGRQGWELVSVSNGSAYFKRKID